METMGVMGQGKSDLSFKTSCYMLEPPESIKSETQNGKIFMIGQSAGNTMNMQSKATSTLKKERFAL